jgi:hypothetical protein
MTKSRGILPPRAYWTYGALDLLRDTYSDVPTADIAALLGCSVSRVYSKAQQLGLVKSAAFLSSMHSGRIQRGRQDPRLKATQFKKGIVPWNKGTHYTAGGRSAETRFKKGSMSGAAQHNYVPIGSYRLTKDGYLEQKYTDDPRLVPTRRWRPVARIVWERHNGPVPKGHMVVFKTGQFTNKLEEITIDRLECISRAENARRNHWARHPNLAAVVPVKAAITRQVNRITRENEQRTTA